MKTGALIFAGFFVAVGGFLVGMEVGWRARDAEPDKIITLTKTCTAEREPTRFTCDADERKHYRRVCLTRIGAELK
jgi:hypothetical protein